MVFVFIAIVVKEVLIHYFTSSTSKKEEREKERGAKMPFNVFFQ